MNVELLAFTQVTAAAFDLMSEEDLTTTNADHLAEVCGRDCYQSHHKPTAATATNETYLANILAQGHFSVLEHASFTVRITGVSRSLTHELVRHRHFSYSQLSQRFVDVERVGYVIHPDILDISDEDDRQLALDILHQHWQHSIKRYTELQKILERNGAKRKVKNQAARMVLPNMTETIIDVSGNHRAWREFFEKRISEGADSEIRELAIEISKIARRLAPNTYQDM